MSRQNYYKGRSVRERLSVDQALVLELVRRERATQPRLGGRKLLYRIGPELEKAGVSIGRDRFLELLKREGLLVVRARSACRTTDSRHGFRIYPNLARDLVLSGPHQLLVSDITYIRTLEGFMYVSLVMDGWSRAIVGHDASDSLEMEGALRAVGKAVAQLPKGHQAMHHSDRGCQYCCGAYIQRLLEHGLRISMTQENHCYENAKAERLNGILKQEYGLGQTFIAKSEVAGAVHEAVSLYNNCRPHTALGYSTPMQAHVRQAA